MKKVKTKVSALLLALCMLASLIPAMPAVTAQAADGEIVLDFSGDGPIAATGSLAAVKIADGYPWEVNLTETTIAEADLGTDGNGNSLHGAPYYGIKFNLSAKTVVYNFNVTEAGHYDIAAAILKNDSWAGDTKVSIQTPSRVAEGEYKTIELADLTWAVATEGKGWKNSGYEPIGEGEVLPYLNAGVNKLILKKEATGSNYFVLQNITFTKSTQAPYAQTIEFSKNSGINTISTIAEATVDNNGWRISDKAGDKISGVSSTANLLADHALLVAGGKGAEYDIAFDFVIEADGIYDISTVMRDYTDFNGVFDVYIDSAEDASFIGRIYNDPNDASKNNTFPVKGLASAELTAGVHTIIFRRNVDDIISTGSYSATEYTNVTSDRGYMRIHSITFTPVTEAKADRVVIEVPSAVTAGETIEAKAWVEMSDGSKLTSLGAEDYITISAVKRLMNIPGGAELVLSEGTVADGVCSKNITVSSLTDIPLLDYNPNFQNMDVADNIVAVGVEAKIDGEIYRTQVQVDVNHAVSDDAVFGSRYAYVTEQPDGTYSVSFIGGLKSIAYEKAGFEVYNGSELVADVPTQSVYKKLSFSDGVTADKTPAYYGAGEDGYIFIAAANKLEAGTYTIKPYVVKDNAKTYHNELSLELN